MLALSPVFARIAMRYLSGALVAYGLMGEEDATMFAMDPDIALIVGAVITAAVEGFYALAKRLGWAT